MHTEKKFFPGTPMNVKNEISSFAIDRGDCPRAESGLFEQEKLCTSVLCNKDFDFIHANTNLVLVSKYNMVTDFL